MSSPQAIGDHNFSGEFLDTKKIPTNLVEACCAGTREPFYWKYEEAADGKASPT